MFSFFKKWLIILVKLSLLGAIAFHIGPLLVWLFGLAGYLSAGSSFVSYVDTPSYPNTLAQLSELNLRGHGERVPLKGLRPIFIVEDNLNKRKRYYITEKGHKRPYTLLGATWPLPAYCLIVMDKNIPKEDYKYVLWHEYFHCFYYGHNNTPGDIMTTMAGYVNERTVDVYLKEIKETYE